MARILYVATSDIHLHTFHRPYLRWFRDQGHLVDIAVEKRGSYVFPEINAYHALKFPRHLRSSAHVASFRRLQRIMAEGSYDLVHCHTPIPSVLARLAAARLRKQGLRVLYTAHGFHFYRGGPRFYWISYFPTEYCLSWVTDGIVTINQEDYGYARDLLRSSRSFLIPGIGIDINRFSPLDDARRIQFKQTLGIRNDERVLLYIAEFIPRKNHQFLIDAVRPVLERQVNVRLILVGNGPLLETTKRDVSRNGLTERVMFAGFREDVEMFAGIADIAVSTSRQEGLGLGVVEQMACAVPALASADKGHRELVDHGVNGFLYTQDAHDEFSEYLARLLDDPDLRESMGGAARAKAHDFSVEKSLESMASIYKEFLS